ncbi:GNAT family N-acetyltransferase [Modestobacter sp. L9-4]|jgi:GNAT superfamily N-acetyltransferase|uniref:GNAT family N-acetyltransferase n=1 Tax=Modestobacter sp. L9-4 TaxID=2851567 RepID=UPI001C77296B|nr:GNAT family N-acetyltransferase [Modestobacter sp. L9-4]QXG77095.1 GNAT family N-acetyltransferase [Modestobacter sp. L9-4]
MSAPTVTATVRQIGQPGDLGWIVQRHAELYAADQHFDRTFEPLVAGIVTDFGTGDPTGKAGWIAELDGRRVGSVLVVPSPQAGVAQLRVLLIDPAARGQRLGEQLVRRAVAFAQEAGYRSMTLWTVSALEAARHIYRKTGFVLTDSSPSTSFGTAVTDEHWTLQLSR